LTGPSLNAHVRFHCCGIDGAGEAGEDGQVYFHEARVLAPEDLAAGIRGQVSILFV